MWKAVHATDRALIHEGVLTGDLYLWLQARYITADETAYQQAMANLYRWEMNPGHTIEEAKRDLEQRAVKVQQVDGTMIMEMDRKVIFLTGLDSKFESAVQGLQTHPVDMNTTVQRLQTVESKLKVNDESAFRARNDGSSSRTGSKTPPAWVKDRDLTFLRLRYYMEVPEGVDATLRPASVGYLEATEQIDIVEVT